MRIAVITSDRHEHRYVLAELYRTLGDQIGLVVLERRPTRRAGLAALKTPWRRYGLVGVIERLLTKLTRKLLKHPHRTAAALTRVLGPAPDLPVGPAYVETASANLAPAVAALQAAAPDLVLVYGTGIVKAPALASARLAALNLHTGLSPYYRGSDCDFWPLYRGEPDRVGATVHECTLAVDGGAIYGTRAAPLQADDDVFAAFARSVAVGAGLYAEIAARLVAGETLTPLVQDFSLGREYRFKDRTLIQDLVMEFRTRSGALKRMIARGD